MQVEFPQIDQIIHAALDDKAYLQKEYVRLMNQCNHFINMSFQEYIDRISREYNHKSLIEILNAVNAFMKEEDQDCEFNKIMFDDFVKNASLVSLSLKKIINSPSKKLVKQEKYLPANKVTQFDAKTMTWLSRRPGVTIEEKISPRNVLPTKVTYFTVDTVENRNTMYLFDILYDYLYGKVYPDGKELPCESCGKTEKKCYELYDKLKTILFLKQKISRSDLRDVPKIKQLRQNNKLLADKEYKQIWDAVRDIDYYEQNCKNIWEHLRERFQFISFLIVCAQISSLKDVYVFDNYSQLIEVEGRIGIVCEDGINTVKFYDCKKENELIVSLSGNSIQVSMYHYQSEDSIKYIKVQTYSKSFDLSGIFEELYNVEENEKRLNESEISLQATKEKITTIQYDLEDFQYKKRYIELLLQRLTLRMEILKVDEIKT